MPPKITGPDDIVTVKGRHLYKGDGTRFFMKGIAFPVPIQDDHYVPEAWISILRQLHSLQDHINTVRVYRMDPKVDYSEFFDEAASLGIYVIVPLTAVMGDGVLDRDKPAPKCYNRRLYKYGVGAIENYSRYPNVLGGLLGNEVMNTLETWKSAPCIKAYGRDLKAHMKDAGLKGGRPLPLIYAAQDSSVSVAVDEVTTTRFNSDYLTCSNDGFFDEDSKAIDIFGVNVESWCSSTGTFKVSDDGTVGPYYKIWKEMHNSSVPLVFSELGCSHLQFDKDNEDFVTEEGTRDWAQVPVVLGDMADTWSGFSAYAYYGNNEFNMFKGGPWAGTTANQTLEPLDDFFNFANQLKKSDDLVSQGGKHHPDAPAPPSCAVVESLLRSSFDLNLYDIDRIRSYGGREPAIAVMYSLLAVFAVIAIVCATIFLKKRSKRVPSAETSGLEVKYQSISC